MANEKYPRMPHLPWSPGATRDDQRLEDVEHFLGREIVVTEKIDGANLCLTRGDVFARTHSGRPTHPLFDQAKALHGRIRAVL